MSDIPKPRGKTLTEALAARKEKRKATLDDIAEKVRESTERMLEISKRTHSGSVMVFSAAVENWLRRAILTKMSGISGRHEARLFENYGPLSSFSAKIDVAFALGLLTTDIWNDMKITKEIRNEFAHSTKFIDFHSSSIQILMKKFSAFDPDAPNPERFFFERANGVVRYLLAITKRTEEVPEQTAA